MHFACSRCGHRQAEDVECGGCGNDIVQDLRESRARYMLHDVESRWLRKRHATFLSIGAAAGVAAFFLSFFVLLDPDDQSGDTNRLPWIIAAVIAIATTGALEALFGRKRKFPYLREYDDSLGG